MKSKTPCPACGEPLSLWRMVAAPTPWSLKCSRCKVKLGMSTKTLVVYLAMGTVLTGSLAFLLLPSFVDYLLTVRGIALRHELPGGWLTGFYLTLHNVWVWLPLVFVLLAPLPVWLLFEVSSSLLIINKGGFRLRK